MNSSQQHVTVGQPVQRWRLALLMFLMYAPAAAMLPLLTHCLEQEFDFTAIEISSICATQALASLAGPFLAGQVADRWWPADRCLAVCAFLAAVAAGLLCNLSDPAMFFWGILAFWLVMAPAMSLSVSVCFAHLSSPEQDFGRVRLWGTVGWVMTNWFLGYWYHDPAWVRALLTIFRPEHPWSRLSDALRLAALLSTVLGLYALTLPRTLPQKLSSSWLAPLAAVKLLRQRSFAVYCAACLGWYVTVAFSWQLTPLLLSRRGVPDKWLTQTLTIAQATEFTSLALLPMLLLRLGLRGSMLLGLFCWCAALVILSVGEPTWLVIGSLSFNGVCVCCFLVSGQVFVNSRAKGDIRASAQALLAFVNALGLLLGNLLVGSVRRAADDNFRVTFAVGAVIALTVLVLFGLGFREED